MKNLNENLNVIPLKEGIHKALDGDYVLITRIKFTPEDLINTNEKLKIGDIVFNKDEYYTITKSNIDLAIQLELTPLKIK